MSDVYLLKYEVLLFEGFEWCIIRDLRSRGNVVLYASHRACTDVYNPESEPRRNKNAYGEGCWSAKDKPRCYICSDAVPDEIQALFVLFEGCDSPMVEKYKGDRNDR